MENDPLIRSHPETHTEGIARLGRDKVNRRSDPENSLLASADSLTAEIHVLRDGVDSLNRHIFWMLVAGILVFLLTVAVGVLSYNTYSLAKCQEQIIQANRQQLDAQNDLFNVVNNPKSTAEQRFQATVAYQRILQIYKEHRDAQDGC
jgi:cytochrome c-type biogenesis protein CcmH/NrfG